jgi:hypothetical protein
LARPIRAREKIFQKGFLGFISQSLALVLTWPPWHTIQNY